MSGQAEGENPTRKARTLSPSLLFLLSLISSIRFFDLVRPPSGSVHRLEGVVVRLSGRVEVVHDRSSEGVQCLPKRQTNTASKNQRESPE